MNKQSIHFFRSIVLLFLVAGGSKCYAQNATNQLQKGQAWKVVLKTTITPTPEATAEEISKIREKEEEDRSVFLISNRFYKMKLTGGYQQIKIREDSVSYTLYKGDKTAYRLDYNKWASENPDKKDRFAHFELFPDSTTIILGKKCYKVQYSPAYDHSIIYTVWYSPDFPSWPWKNFGEKKIPGLILKMSFIKEHKKFTTKAVQLKKVAVRPADFEVPSTYQILNLDGSVYHRELEAQKEVYENSRDSLLTVLQSIRSDKVYEVGTVVKYGFARVKVNDSTNYYVDMSGAYAFDRIVANYKPITEITAKRPGWISIDRHKSIRMFIVRKQGNFGLISSKTGWVLPPQYDYIKIDFDRYLLLMKNGKQGYADTWGNVIVPVKFDEVNIMDEQHFDVKIGDKWGVYDAEKEKLIIPTVYDEFDFCGGCGGKVTYAYAKKNGKWGILAFDGTVLLPFKYEHHGHYGMRSDNWVLNFEKNGKDVVINMIGDKVYSPPEYADMQVVSSVLAAKKGDKYGLINDQNEVVLPFVYDDIGHFYDNFHWGPYILVYKNNKAGVVTNTGEIVIPPDTYEHIFGTGEGYFGASIAGKWMLLDTLGNLISPQDYALTGFRYPEEAKNAQGEKVLLFPLKKDTLVGMYNLYAQTVLEPRFSSVDVVSPDSTHYFIEVEIEGKGKGLYSLKGKELMPPKYTDYEFLNSDMVRIQNKDYDYGIYSLKTHKVVLPQNYSRINPLNQRYYLLSRKVDSVRREMVWDAQRQTILDFKRSYHHITRVGELLLAVYNKDKAYLYDLKKRAFISKVPYDYIGRFKHGLAEVRNQNEQYGFINTQGEVVIPLKYDDVEMDKHGLIKVFKKVERRLRKYGFIDSTGTQLTPIKYSFNDDLGYTDWGNPKSAFLKISRYDKSLGKTLFGMLTLDGQEVVPPKYEKVIPFQNGNGFLVKTAWGWGILNRQGREVVPPVIDNIYFSDTYGYAKNVQFPILCELNNTYFYVKQSGDFLPFTIKEVTRFGRRFWY